MRHEVVERVVSYVALKNVRHRSETLVGVMNFGGEDVPVIDFLKIAEGRYVEEKFGARIVICVHPLIGSGMVGILLEEVIGTIRREDTGKGKDDSGGMLEIEGKLWKELRMEDLLTDDVLDDLRMEELV